MPVELQSLCVVELRAYFFIFARWHLRLEVGHQSEGIIYYSCIFFIKCMVHLLNDFYRLEIILCIGADISLCKANLIPH